MNIIQNADISILLYIQEHIRKEWMNGFWRTITFLGDGGWFWILLAVVLLIMKKTRKAGAAAAIALVIGALITNVCLKNMVARVRPYDTYSALIPIVTKPIDWSFPSGHTCASFASAFVYFRLLPKKYGIPALSHGLYDRLFKAVSGSSLSYRCTGRLLDRPVCFSAGSMDGKSLLRS